MHFRKAIRNLLQLLGFSSPETVTTKDGSSSAEACSVEQVDGVVIFR